MPRLNETPGRKKSPGGRGVVRAFRLPGVSQTDINVAVYLLARFCFHPPIGQAVDSTRVYFAAASGIKSVSLDGGAPVTLTSSSGNGVAIDDGRGPALFQTQAQASIFVPQSAGLRRGGP